MYVSWRLDKGYSAAGARSPQLGYFKMFFYCNNIFYKVQFNGFFLEGYQSLCYPQTIAITTYILLWQTVTIIQLVS